MAPPLEKINHAQIAHAAGVSRSTVSRALQNHPSLLKETRERIQRLAREMGYRPNPLLSALMAARNQPGAQAGAATLAVLTAWRPSRDLAPLPTNKRILAGANARADELGYRMEEFWLDEPGMSLQRLERILISRGIAAVIIAPILPAHPRIELRWEHFSCATFAHYRQLPSLHCAAHFHFRAYLNAIAELAALGYRRPGLILDTETPPHVLQQWAGAHHAALHFPKIAKKDGAAGEPKLEPLAPLLLEGVTPEKVARWCAKHRPDVVLSNIPALPGWLEGLPSPVARRLAFASLDRYPENPAHAGIDQSHEVIGSAAVDLVVSQLNRNERGLPEFPKTVLIDGIWCPGPSAPGVG